MPNGKRKVPFSGKAKKQQLQAKKQVKAPQLPNVNPGRSKNLLIGCGGTSEEGEIRKLNYQPGRNSSNRYVLEFRTETPEEIRANKERARESLVPASEKEMEIDIEAFFPPDLKFPVRPGWDFSMSKRELDGKENKYFTSFVKELEEKFGWSELSYFELNLETWRQLWRVLEIADIVLIIVDARFPALMFPPMLYDYVTKTLNKDMILVLNKIDLAPAPLVVAWKHYLKSKFPELGIVMFTSFPSYNIRGNSANKAGLQIRRRKGKIRMSAEGAQKLLDACKEIVKDKVDLSSWQSKITEEMSTEYEDEEIDIGETVEVKHQDTSYEEHERYKGGILTIGCIGQPNVGKSSLMNALMGKKVVSVSRTPGHTKHFQTIFLTKNVRLCDCPGLVFPSKVPKTLQVLMGSFPIAQVKEPFSTVKFLAERLDLVSLLKIKHPENDEYWSAMDICEGWALKKGFYTARAARLDAYRAANHLLRMSLEGKISISLTPPDYSTTKEVWKNDGEVKTVEWIQALGEGEASLREAVVLETEEGSETETSEEEMSPGAPASHQPEELDADSEDNEEDDDDEDDEESRILGNKFQALGAD